jgi:hypothetical protein
LAWWRAWCFIARPWCVVIVDLAVVSGAEVVDCVLVSGGVVSGVAGGVVSGVAGGVLGGGMFCAATGDAASAIAASEAMKSFISSLLSLRPASAEKHGDLRSCVVTILAGLADLRLARKCSAGAAGMCQPRPACPRAKSV